MQNDQESLSTLMDGETDGRDGSTLGRIAATEDERSAWARYHLIGDVIRDGLTEVAPPEFAQKLRIEIGREPTILAPRRKARSLLRPAAGLAIAASVAALAVLGVKQLNPSQGLDPAPEIADVTPAVVGEPLIATQEHALESPNAVDRLHESLPSQRRFNSYLVKFNEQRSSLGVPGVNPYVRIVGFESN